MLRDLQLLTPVYKGKLCHAGHSTFSVSHLHPNTDPKPGAGNLQCLCSANLFCVQMSATELSLGYHCIIVRPVFTPDSLRVPEKLIWQPTPKKISAPALP